MSTNQNNYVHRALLEEFSPSTSKHRLLQDQLDNVIHLVEGKLRVQDNTHTHTTAANNTGTCTYRNSWVICMHACMYVCMYVCVVSEVDGLRRIFTPFIGVRADEDNDQVFHISC